MLTAVNPLLRAYQEEVDKLTNRCIAVSAHLFWSGNGPVAADVVGTCRAKFGEAAFLDVYQKLYEAPDPAPTLNGAMVRLLLAQQSSARPGLGLFLAPPCLVL